MRPGRLQHLVLRRRGAFTDPLRWSNGVPGVADTALFTAAGTYTVIYNASPTISTLNLSAGNLSFVTADATPRTLTLSNALLLSGGSLTLGTSAGILALNTAALQADASKLVISNGNALNASQLSLASMPPIQGYFSSAAPADSASPPRGAPAAPAAPWPSPAAQFPFQLTPPFTHTAVPPAETSSRMALSGAAAGESLLIPTGVAQSTNGTIAPASP